MKGITILTCFTVLIFMMIIPMLTKADDVKSLLYFKKNYSISLPCRIDSLPPKVKNVDIVNDNHVEETIKSVPKAHKQAIPLPVKVQVKPVNIIKPKIIKPIIKLLH